MTPTGPGRDAEITNNRQAVTIAIHNEKLKTRTLRPETETKNQKLRTENRELNGMKAPNPWITYRTRFLVKAKQLTTSLTFIDLLGRHQSGRKGDYLVESSEGILSIAPRQIFEDIYVPLLAGETPAQDQIPEQPWTPPQYQARPQDETSSPAETERQRQAPTPSLPLHLTRKSPQPYRDRRSPSPGLRSF